MENWYNIETQLNQLYKELDIINETIRAIDNKMGFNEIEVGSRVLINWEKGLPSEGRVISKRNDGSFKVKRDNAGEIWVGVNHDKIMKHTLQNLSVGTYGKLEKQRWILQNKISQIKKVAYPLRKVLSRENALLIIKSVEFQNWYSKNGYTQVLEIGELSEAPPFFVTGLVKEYLDITTPEPL